MQNCFLDDTLSIHLNIEACNELSDWYHCSCSTLVFFLKRGWLLIDQMQMLFFTMLRALWYHKQHVSCGIAVAAQKLCLWLEIYRWLIYCQPLIVDSHISGIFAGLRFKLFCELELICFLLNMADKVETMHILTRNGIMNISYVADKIGKSLPNYRRSN